MIIYGYGKLKACMVFAVYDNATHFATARYSYCARILLQVYKYMEVHVLFSFNGRDLLADCHVLRCGQHHVTYLII